MFQTKLDKAFQVKKINGLWTLNIMTIYFNKHENTFTYSIISQHEIIAENCNKDLFFPTSQYVAAGALGIQDFSGHGIDTVILNYESLKHNSVLQSQWGLLWYM